MNRYLPLVLRFYGCGFMYKNLFNFKMNKRYFFLFAMLLLQALVCLTTFEWLARESFVEFFRWISLHPVYVIYNLVILFLILWLLYALCNDLRWGYVIWQCVILIFGVAESIKLDERKEYIEFSDILITGDWTEAVSDVQFQNWQYIIISVALMLALLIFFWYTKPFWKRMRSRRNVIVTTVSITVCLLGFLFGVYYPVVKNGISERVVLGMQGEVKGGIVCFAESIAYHSMSSADTDSIYTDALSYFGLTDDGSVLETQSNMNDSVVLATQNSVENIEIKPNIIVIMSEALWDINQLSEAVSFDKNPMEAFDAIGSGYVQGKAASNVFGGGTDKSEFEFLTGWNSRYAVNGSSPYRDFFTQGQASIVQYLKELGYLAYAIHPYKGTFWGRNTAYKNMSFDDFYNMDNMKYQDKYDVFISDGSLTNEIIYRYEERRESSDAPVFSFNVSIANHVTKIAEGEAAPTSRDVHVTYNIDYTKISAYNRKKLGEYVNGVYVSGQALTELVEYFSEVDEPTVIMVFGDHAPSFVSEFEDYVREEVVSEGFYETPFYIWNNYGLGEFGEDEVNISYLSELLLEYIDFPLPKQAVLNKYLRLFCPVDTRFLVKDSLGNAVDVSDNNYINRSFGMSNTMHYALYQNSYNMDIWKVLP